MMAVITLISASVFSFSRRYLAGDSKQRYQLCHLVAISFSLYLLVCIDNFILFLFAWFISNSLLTRMMLHKSNWPAAKASARLARDNFMIGFIFLTAAFLCLNFYTGLVSIQSLLIYPLPITILLPSGLLLLLAAMTQSALWPFHRWLISSLNSPTPVSAMMHAGLVNGGGFLLIRFAPLFLQQQQLLLMVFLVGLLTTVLGTSWKLMQADVKRMLACSTLGQMGFMILQCGLGFFSLALMHLCGHACFKAYLFLASGSASKEKRVDSARVASFTSILVALSCGVVASYLFVKFNQRITFSLDTNLFVIALIIMFATQLMLSLSSNTNHFMIPILFIITLAIVIGYGLMLNVMETYLLPLNLLQPQPLTAIHLIALIILVMAWLCFINRASIKLFQRQPQWLLKLYVYMLNASQPDPRTVTLHRNQYQYR